MQISWFTVIAQVINFLILVFLLKRFLYKPVLKAIDEREKKIVARLEDAKAMKAAAKNEQDDFAQKNEDFDNQKKELMNIAIAESNKQKDILMEDARKAASNMQSKQQKAMQDTQENFKKEMAQKTQEEVLNLSRKALSDLASASLEEKAVTLFVSRVQALEGDGKQQFIHAFKSASAPILIQTAFELHKDQQQEIAEAVKKVLGKQITFQFKTAPEIISGIELTSNGYKLEWSISAWLNALQTSISETGEKKIKPEKKANQQKELTEKV